MLFFWALPPEMPPFFGGHSIHSYVHCSTRQSSPGWLIGDVKQYWQYQQRYANGDTGSLCGSYSEEGMLSWGTPTRPLYGHPYAWYGQKRAKHCRKCETSHLMRDLAFWSEISHFVRDLAFWCESSHLMRNLAFWCELSHLDCEISHWSCIVLTSFSHFHHFNFVQNFTRKIGRCKFLRVKILNFDLFRSANNHKHDQRTLHALVLACAIAYRCVINIAKIFMPVHI